MFEPDLEKCAEGGVPDGVTDGVRHLQPVKVLTRGVGWEDAQAELWRLLVHL